jgi:hypothetical protein
MVGEKIGDFVSGEEKWREKEVKIGKPMPGGPCY